MDNIIIFKGSSLVSSKLVTDLSPPPWVCRSYLAPTASLPTRQQQNVRYFEVGAGVHDAHSDHLHTVEHIDHFSFTDLDEVALKQGNACEHGELTLAQLLLQLAHGAMGHVQHEAALGAALHGIMLLLICPS